MPSNLLNPMAKIFWSITQITNQELDEAWEILSLPVRQYIYPLLLEPPASDSDSAGGFSHFGNSETSPILASDIGISVYGSPEEPHISLPFLADENFTLACPNIQHNSNTGRTLTSKALSPISDCPSQYDLDYEEWKQKIQTVHTTRNASSKYDSKLHYSETSTEYRRFCSIQDRMRFLGFHRSPCIPQSFSEYLYLRECGIEAKRIKLLHKIKDVKDSRKVTIPCFGGRRFALGRSPVLSEEGIWARPTTIVAAAVGFVPW